MRCHTKIKLSLLLAIFSCLPGCTSDSKSSSKHYPYGDTRLGGQSQTQYLNNQAAYEKMTKAQKQQYQEERINLMSQQAHLRQLKEENKDKKTAIDPTQP
jgi:outer membrane lipopolysaccharide assembly protein LptE/RlpB